MEQVFNFYVLVLNPLSLFFSLFICLHYIAAIVPIVFDPDKEGDLLVWQLKYTLPVNRVLGRIDVHLSFPDMKNVVDKTKWANSKFELSILRHSSSK